VTRTRIRAAGLSLAATLAVMLTLATGSLLAVGGLAGTAAQASTTAATSWAAARLPTADSSAKAKEFAYFNARQPLLRKYLAEGYPLQVALRKAGFPALRITIVGRGPDGLLVHPNGASCQDFTCGWKFSATTTYEMEYLIWIGEIAGPGGICLLFGSETAGIACTISGGIYAVLSAYAFPIPQYTGKCLYAGIGVGEVVKLEKC
jgi:hypothetical protein